MKILIYTLCSCLWIFNFLFYGLYTKYLDTVEWNRGNWCGTPVARAETEVTFFFFAYVPYLIIAIFFGIKAWKKLKWQEKTFFIASSVVGILISCVWTIELM